MKKLIIICLLALSYTSTQAQEPTKQETMDWIASKFKNYLHDNLEYKYLSNGIICFEDKIYEIRYKIDLNKVKSYSYFRFNGIQGLVCIQKGFDRGSREVSCETSFNFESYFDTNGEDNLHDRFVKATSVLVKYNTAGTVEKF
jgi:hypothetical protein